MLNHCAQCSKIATEGAVEYRVDSRKWKRGREGRTEGQNVCALQLAIPRLAILQRPGRFGEMGLLKVAQNKVAA